MSSMEYHRGKAKKFPRNAGESDFDYLRRFAEHLGKPFLEEAVKENEDEGLHEMMQVTHLEGPWRRQWALAIGDDLWELIDHVYEDDPGYINTVTQNADGTTSFVMSFYNGGTCLEEVLGEALEKVPAYAPPAEANLGEGPQTFRVVDTDNFDGDYPNEKFVGPTVTKAAAELVAKAFNSCAGEHSDRFYKVVEHTFAKPYKLRPGFEP